MESAFKLAEHFVASVTKPARPSTPEDAANPHQYDGPPRTAEQVAAQVTSPAPAGDFFCSQTRPTHP